MATSTIAQTLQPISVTATGNHDLRLATVTQTLPAITQSATGWYMFQVVETGLATGIPLGIYSDLLTDTATTSDTLFAIVNDDLQDAANVSNTITYVSLVTLNEAATAASSWSTTQSHTFSPSSLRTRVSFKFSFSDTTTSTVNVSNTIDTFIELVLQETAYASNALTPQNNAALTHTTTAAADGYVTFYAAVQALSETANASGIIVEWNAPAELLSETANASSSTPIQYTEAFEDLLGGADASNLITFEGSEYNNSQHETAVAASTLWAQDFGTVAWVLNTETGGLSNYDNFEFTSIAEYNGVLYATSPNGVYQLTGTEDDGRRIDVSVKTGFLDFREDRTKRISDVFLGYTGGQLEFDVETYDGPQDVYTYTLEERDADAPRNNRLKVGRGLSSRYWRFAVRNVDGAEFQLYDVAANVGVSKRRL